AGVGAANAGEAAAAGDLDDVAHRDRHEGTARRMPAVGDRSPAHDAAAGSERAGMGSTHAESGDVVELRDGDQLRCTGIAGAVAVRGLLVAGDAALGVVVLAPAHDRAVAAPAARMEPSAADLDELVRALGRPRIEELAPVDHPAAREERDAAH